MKLKERFIAYIRENKLICSGETVLAAVSGGIDSVVLCDLLHQAGYIFAIAHCNFGLRGKESEMDEKFVREMARKYRVKYFTKKFNTAEYGRSKNISIQMAARELRFSWFEELRQKERLDQIAVATQKNDLIETFFINTARGTGISGLHGILNKRGKVIRPLLFATRGEIVQYASGRKLSWREDTTNGTDDYVRNKIRHHVVPVLKEINPEIEKTVEETIVRLRETEEIFHQQINNMRKKIFVTTPAFTGLDIKLLSKLTPLKTYLYEFLKGYGFKEDEVSAIMAGLNSQPGKKYYSHSHVVFKDREFLLIKKKPAGTVDNKKSRERTVKKITSEIKSPLHIKFSVTENKNFKIINRENVACIDYDSINFPLVLRPWREGDSFSPLGMKGSRKISDFLIGKKIPLPDKENVYVLTSMGKIIWVVGMRMDNAFKIQQPTKKILIAELIEK